MKKALLGSLAIGLVVVASPAFADDAVKGTQQTTIQQPTSVTTTTAGQAPQMSDAALSPAQTAPVERDTVTLYQNNRPNKAYLYTGGALFLGSYATTAAVNAASDIDRSLYIPVVGPWLHIAERDSNADTLGTVLIAGSGVVQGIGVLMTTASFFIPEKVPAATIQAGNVKINVTPTAYGRGSAGIGAVGTF